MSLLFSLNIALVAELARANTLSLAWGLPLEVQLRINTFFHLHPHSKVGGYVSFLTLALGLALCLFLLLRLFSSTIVAKSALHYAAGILSLLALPACWFYFLSFGHFLTLDKLPVGAVLLEFALALVCAVMYLRAKWPLPGWCGVVLLISHRVFWHWLFFGGFYVWLDPIALVFAMAGLASTLAWGLYVSQQRTHSGSVVSAPLKTK